jgi:aspartate/methionine/tyrosine aminotransferase
MHAVLAVTDPGDEVVLPVPYYFNHEMAVRIAGAEPVFVPTDDAYRLQAGAIAAAITPRTRAVVTVSPNNPTGTVYDEASLRAVSALCRARGLFHISDEAYEYFTYDGVPHVSPGAFEGAGAYTLSLFSLSKAYGMAGWRVGYMALPRALLPAVKKIQDTILICPPVPSQLAALGAMEAGAAYPGQHIGSLAEVRHLVLDALAQLGDRVTVPPAEGAFYLFARVHTDRDALTLVERLIREHRVAVIPGETFGTAGGCYLRIAYGALQHDTVAEAMERLVRGIRALIGG